MHVRFGSPLLSMERATSSTSLWNGGALDESSLSILLSMRLCRYRSTVRSSRLLRYSEYARTTGLRSVRRKRTLGMYLMMYVGHVRQ